MEDRKRTENLVSGVVRGDQPSSLMDEEISLRTIMQARHDGDLGLMNEASLGRAFQHFKKSGETSFGIITAWRAKEPSGKPRTAATNKANMKRLASKLRSWNLGFSKMRGGWVECTQTDDQGNPIPYEKCPDESKQHVTEPVFFVTGITLDQLKKLVKEFNQDAGLYRGPESKEQTLGVWNDGSVDQIGRGFSPMKVTQFFTKVRGKPFVFEWIAQGDSWGEAAAVYAFERSHREKAAQ
jgi:hypothetical protein